MPVHFEQKLRELGLAVGLNGWARDRPDPFHITGPAVISFSGGRTSAYMLWRILESHHGVLPDDVVVLFQNTGKEMEPTLEFVRDVSERWLVPITWLEYEGANDKPSYRVTDYRRAARNGEPFKDMLARKSALPNPVARFCTIELKIRTAKRYLVDVFGWKRWTNVVGLRADEPGRVVKATDPARNKKDRWDVICPLFEAGVEQIDVLQFWKARPFDLRLAGPWEGNCDGCFLKSRASLMQVEKDHPGALDWWAAQEAVPRGDGAGKTFRKGAKYAYAAILADVAAERPAPTNEPDLPCDDLGCGI